MPRFSRLVFGLLFVLFFSTAPAWAAPFGDLNCDGGVNVTDVQLAILVVLEIPLDPFLDGDQDGTPDACGSAGSGMVCGTGTLPNPEGTACVVDPAVLDQAFAEGAATGVPYGCQAEGTKIAAAIFEDTDFSYATFLNADIQNSHFNGSVLVQTDFSGALLDTVYFSHCDVAETNFTAAMLDNSTFVGATLTDAIFVDAVVTDTSFNSADVHNTSFVNTNLNGSTFQYTWLQNSDFSGADFKDAEFSGTMIDGSTFSGATFTGAKMGMLVMEGDFTESDFKYTDMSGGVFTHSNFHGADVTNAIWDNTVCPDWTNSDDNGGTCCGHFTTTIDGVTIEAVPAAGCP